MTLFYVRPRVEGGSQNATAITLTRFECLDIHSQLTPTMQVFLICRLGSLP